MNEKLIPIIIIGFSFCLGSCEKKSSSEPSTTTEKAPAEAADTHDLIFEEYIALGTQVSNGMTSLKDKASAENFKTIIESAPEKLEALLERTTQIDSPTDEQKAAFKNTNEELEQKMQTAGMEMAKNMQTNPPSPEDMAAIGTIMQEVMGGEIGKKMEELTDKIDAFYDLK